MKAINISPFNTHDIIYLCIYKYINIHQTPTPTWGHVDVRVEDHGPLHVLVKEEEVEDAVPAGGAALWCFFFSGLMGRGGMLLFGLPNRHGCTDVCLAVCLSPHPYDI